MRYNIIGKNVSVSDSLKDRVQSKIGRISKLFPENTEVQVTLIVEKFTNKVEVTIPLKKRLLRAEVQSDDMYAAIDEIVDVLEKQMIKYKNRLRARGRQDSKFNEEFVTLFDKNEFSEEDSVSNKIEKTKRFEIKPMDPEEAVMEMELLDHSFFVFRNGQNDEVNVVYKRKNGTYGLIEPEY